ncbi:MAG: MoaD/ThiS family protein [Lachnospiraceae bacterium]
MVNIKLAGPFGKCMEEINEDGFWVVDKAGETVLDFLQTTAVKDEFMNYAIVVNGKTKKKDYVMQDGDTVKVIPLFAAG